VVLLAALTTAACRAQITQTCLTWTRGRGHMFLPSPPFGFTRGFAKTIPHITGEVDLIRELTGRGTPSAATASPQ
jgi:hypothetical protein